MSEPINGSLRPRCGKVHGGVIFPRPRKPGRAESGVPLPAVLGCDRATVVALPEMGGDIPLLEIKYGDT
jgi:hypothetical protein